MKIRTGFVSNSSSSSFCIYGVAFDEGENPFGNNEEVIQKLIDSKERWHEDIKTREDALEYLEDNLGEVADEVLSDSGLESNYPEYCGLFIGKSWCKIQDDQTGKEFKEEIKAIMKKLMPQLEDKDFDTHEYAWRDG